MIRILAFICFICGTFTSNSQCLDDFWHNTSANSIWKSCNVSASPVAELGQSHWILYEFDQIQTIKSLRIWNINHPEQLTSGARRIRVDISSNGTTWDNMGIIDVGMGSTSRTYLGEEFENLGTFDAQFVLLTILQNHGSVTCSGLAEVQFNLSESTTPTDDEYLSSLVTVFPNPSSDRFNISLDGINTSNISYRLVDMTGRILLQDKVQTSGSNNEIDINGISLPDGMYSLRIDTDQGSIAKKLVVVHPR